MKFKRDAKAARTVFIFGFTVLIHQFSVSIQILFLFEFQFYSRASFGVLKIESNEKELFGGGEIYPAVCERVG